MNVFVHLLSYAKNIRVSMSDREISPEGSKFQTGTRLAESLVENPTSRVRFPYPTWTGS